MSDDAARVNLTTGLLRKAVNAKTGRQRQLDEAEAASMGQAPPPPAPAKGAMTQFEFGGTGKMTDDEKARKAKGLADALRKHNR